MESDTFKYIQIFTTTVNKKEAEKITKVLIENKLAACAQILGPIESIYRWKGKIEKTKEFLCLIKSKANKKETIIKKIKAIHNYEVPEIIVTPIIGGDCNYLRWIEKEI